MNLLKEMPKITKCLKCLKLRYSVDFIKLETQGMLLYYFSNFRFCIRQTSTVHNQTERSDTTILGNLGILVHFRHFLVYPD
jgi:hypothetical protein